MMGQEGQRESSSSEERDSRAPVDYNMLNQCHTVAKGANAILRNADGENNLSPLPCTHEYMK